MDEAASYYQHARSEMAEFLPRERATVLEVGCGGGHFRDAVGPTQEYWGIEPSADAAARARLRLDRVLHGTFDEHAASLPDRHFDLVVCNDVIEHMPDHDRFLTAIKPKLAVGGCLVGSIPNVRHLFNLIELLRRKDWQYRADGILDRTHLRFFTERSLRRTLVENGYRIELLHGINPEYERGDALKRALYRLAVGLLGDDVKYLQFGFRAQPE